MWTLAVVIFLACKWLTWLMTEPTSAPLWLHIGYWLAWPGLDAPGFLKSARTRSATRPTCGEWLFAASKTVAGLGILFGLARLVPSILPYWQGWVGMIGLIMSLHFGSFHLLSCAWRSIGIEARPLMNWPLVSTSASEFWGRRWNTAFRDLAHRFLFRPLTRRVGPRGAILGGFLFSGIVHDVVISIPAGGGYGGPTLFFVIQACVLLIERRWTSQPLVGWFVTMSVLVLSVVLLFHPPFVEGIIVPFLHALFALPP